MADVAADVRLALHALAQRADLPLVADWLLNDWQRIQGAWHAPGGQDQDHALPPDADAADRDYGPGGLMLVKLEAQSRVMRDDQVRGYVANDSNHLDTLQPIIREALIGALVDVLTEDEGEPWAANTTRTVGALLADTPWAKAELGRWAASVFRDLRAGKGEKLDAAPPSPWWRVLRLYTGEDADYDTPAVVAWLDKYARTMEDAQNLLNDRDNLGEVSHALGRRISLDELAQRAGYTPIAAAPAAPASEAARTPARAGDVKGYPDGTVLYGVAAEDGREVPIYAKADGRWTDPDRLKTSMAAIRRTIARQESMGFPLFVREPPVDDAAELDRLAATADGRRVVELAEAADHALATATGLGREQELALYDLVALRDPFPASEALLAEARATAERLALVAWPPPTAAELRQAEDATRLYHEAAQGFEAAAVYARTGQPRRSRSRFDEAVGLLERATTRAGRVSMPALDAARDAARAERAQAEAEQAEADRAHAAAAEAAAAVRDRADAGGSLSRPTTRGHVFAGSAEAAAALLGLPGYLEAARGGADSYGAPAGPAPLTVDLFNEADARWYPGIAEIPGFPMGTDLERAVEGVLEDPAFSAATISALRLRQGKGGPVVYSWAYGQPIREGDLAADPAAGIIEIDRGSGGIIRLVQWGANAATDDYPLGRRSRGEAKWAVEVKPRHGARVVRQTRPEGRARWSQPKATTYSRRARLAMGADGRVYFVMEPHHREDVLELYDGTLRRIHTLRQDADGDLFDAVKAAAFAAVPVPEAPASASRPTKWDTMRDAVWARFPAGKRSGTKGEGNRAVGGVPLDGADNAAVEDLYREHVISETRPTAPELAAQLREGIGPLFDGYLWRVSTPGLDEVRFTFWDVPETARRLDVDNAPYHLRISIGPGKGFRWLRPGEDGEPKPAPPKLKTETALQGSDTWKGGGWRRTEPGARAGMKPRGTSGTPEQVLQRVLKWLRKNAEAMKQAEPQVYDLAEHPRDAAMLRTLVEGAASDYPVLRLSELYRDSYTAVNDVIRAGLWRKVGANGGELTAKGRAALLALDGPTANPLLLNGGGGRSLVELARFAGYHDLADWMRGEWPMLRAGLRDPAGLETADGPLVRGEPGGACEPPVPACVAPRRAKGRSK